MPIYRQAQSGQFVPFEKTRYSDLERDFESWMESNPYLLLENEPLAIIGRQVSTRFGKVADLLAVDESGACVVIELKRGTAPREVIAQTLEYTAWVDSLTLEELHTIAREYSVRRGTEVEGVWDLYRGTFEHQSEDPEESEVERRTTLNARQRMVIVAEEFPPEMEQTLRYIRSKHGVDISAVRFGLHRSGDDILLETEVVVGRETLASTTEKTEATSVPQSHEEIRQRATSDFVRQVVDRIEDWIASLQVPGLEVHHYKGSHHSLYLNGKRLGGWYFARTHLRFWFNDRRPDDDQLEGLSNPSSLSLKDTNVAGNLMDNSDLALYQSALRARLAAYSA
jgi:hypothetical protein